MRVLFLPCRAVAIFLT